MNTRIIPLPMSPDNWAILTIDPPVTEPEWEQMMRTLEAMRPALVVTDPDGGAGDGEEDRT